MQTLQRQIFETSRQLEYFTEKELAMQIGFDSRMWPVAILRELIDNALDAAESIGVDPEISVVVDEDTISVADNGPGIPEQIIRKSLDYSVRVSDKALYVSPTRGQLGNALKVVWAAPFVMSGTCRVDIATQGDLHHIEIALDRIAQTPRIEHTVDRGVVKNEQFIALAWPDSTSSLTTGENGFFYKVTAPDLIIRYIAFNPHAAFTYNGQRIIRTGAPFKKWNANSSTSAH